MRGARGRGRWRRRGSGPAPARRGRCARSGPASSPVGSRGTVSASSSTPSASGADCRAAGQRLAARRPPDDDLRRATELPPLTRFTKYDGDAGSMLRSSKSSVTVGSGPGGSPGVDRRRVVGDVGRPCPSTRPAAGSRPGRRRRPWWCPGRCGPTPGCTPSPTPDGREREARRASTVAVAAFGAADAGDVGAAPAVVEERPHRVRHVRRVAEDAAEVAQVLAVAGDQPRAGSGPARWRRGRRRCWWPPPRWAWARARSPRRRHRALGTQASVPSSAAGGSVRFVAGRGDRGMTSVRRVRSERRISITVRARP